MTGCAPGEPDQICRDAVDKVGAILARGGVLWSDLRHLIWSNKIAVHCDEKVTAEEALSRYPLS